MELIKIVDENGNFTGTIMDKDKAHDQNLLHWEVAMFIINNEKQVLLQKRSASKRFHPNKWALCAGHVDADEELEVAALREMEEEVGLKIPTNELHLLEEKEVKVRESNSHLTRYYYVICNKNESEFIIQEEELSEVKWFDIDEIIRMIKENDDSIVFGDDRIYLFEKLKELF